MDNQVLIDIISKDIREIDSLVESFGKFKEIPPIFLELTLSKVKNLYVELQLLGKEAIDFERMKPYEEIADTISHKQTHIQVQMHSEAPIAKPQNKHNGEATVNKDIAVLQEDEANIRKRAVDSLTTQLKYPPIDNIKKNINLNDKIWFTKELFDGNLEMYNSTLLILDNFKNLDEALEYIDHHFAWDNDNQTTKKFMQLIYRRFA